MIYLVDPTNITNYELSDEELELTLLWWICAAGKNAMTAARGLSLVMEEINPCGMSPFEAIRRIENLSEVLRRNGIGCYNNKARTMRDLAESGLDLRKCSRDNLTDIYGIGMKTASCFLIHSRRDVCYAGLDVHLLHHMRDLGYDVPSSTPTSKKKYLEIEQKLLDLIKKSGQSVADYDLGVWKEYRDK